MTRIRGALFFAIISELILGGGGRLLAVGPVSLRMVLFSIAMVFTAVDFVKGKRLPSELIFFLVLFLGSLVLALSIGILSGAAPAYYIEDIKPLLYVLILPFFYFAVSDLKLAKAIPPLIIWSAVTMTVTFITVLILIHSGILPFLKFYDSVIQTDEFFFRAETTFFYKGFIFLCIAMVFVCLIKSKYRTLLIVLLGLSIVLTFTRGFIFALALTWLFYSFLEKKYLHLTASIFVLIFVIFFAKPAIYQISSLVHSLKGYDQRVVPKDQLLGNRNESDAGRSDQLREVFTRVIPSSFIFGHGFGNGVPSRPVHMEISYLEIFHKQGLIGLSIWGYLFYLVFTRFKRCKNPEMKAYFYSVSLLFFQSITNQFINNPIGLSFILLSLCVLEHNSIQRLSEELVMARSRHQKGDEISATNF